MGIASKDASWAAMLRADAVGLAAAGPHAAAAVVAEAVREGDLFGMAPGDFAMLANAARLQTGGSGDSHHTQPYLLKIILDRLPAPEQGAAPLDSGAPAAALLDRSALRFSRACLARLLRATRNPMVRRC